jgi:hypothetical protein
VDRSQLWNLEPGTWNLETGNWKLETGSCKLRSVPFSYDEFDLSGVRTYALKSRKSKANAADFARPHVAGSSVGEFVASLPSILAGSDFKAVVAALRKARASEAGIMWGIGAHVIKTGVSPVLIDLMERGFVSAIAMNGAGVIHDFELAVSGGTSEDVDEALGPGQFGMAEETHQLNAIIKDAAAGQQGIGQGVSEWLVKHNPPHADLSVLAAAARLRIPVTVHVAIGTDIIHMHSDASGAAIGDASLRDFRYFVSNVARLERGVYLNLGSAVVLPEVFLKAVALVRNRGISLTGLTTVNLDFMRMYRPQTNVVSRPVAGIGKGYSIVGHHEIMIPLLAAALVDR